MTSGRAMYAKQLTETVPLVAGAIGICLYRYHSRKVASNIFRDSIEDFPVSLLAITKTGQVHAWNKWLTALTGWTAQQVLGRQLADILEVNAEVYSMCSRLPCSITELVSRAVAGENITEQETAICTAPSGHRWVKISANKSHLTQSNLILLTFTPMESPPVHVESFIDAEEDVQDNFKEEDAPLVNAKNLGALRTELLTEAFLTYRRDQSRQSLEKAKKKREADSCWYPVPSHKFHTIEQISRSDITEKQPPPRMSVEQLFDRPVIKQTTDSRRLSSSLCDMLAESTAAHQGGFSPNPHVRWEDDEDQEYDGQSLNGTWRYGIDRSSSEAEFDPEPEQAQALCSPQRSMQQSPEPEAVDQAKAGVSSRGEFEEQLQQFRGKRVLVCDDHATQRGYIVRQFQVLGCEVAEVAHGDAACRLYGYGSLEAPKEAPFDVVVMDIMMPAMDGDEAMVEIRRLEANARLSPCLLVALTSLEESELADASKHHADAVLNKPLTKAKIARLAPRLAPAQGAGTPTSPMPVAA